MRAKALVGAITVSLLFVLLSAATVLPKAMVAHAGYVPVGTTASATALETWENFQPSGWVNFTNVDCVVQVYHEAGFTEEAEYQYRTGGDWSSWTGNGLQITWLEHARRRLTIPGLAVPHSETEDQNQIKFRMKSALDEWLESGAYLVRVDTSMPSATVAVSPCYQSEMEIRGTATDSGSGVSLVEIQLQRAVDGLYFNGSSWQEALTWLVASGSTTWSLPFVPTTETVYTVTARATDNAGNVQDPPSTATFRYDATSPQSTVMTVGYFRTDNWPGSIAGTANDIGIGVSQVQIRLQRSLDGFYYDGATASWSAAATWITVSGTTAWSLPFMPSAEAVYTITSLATDECGNVETVPDTGVFIYDNTPPGSTVLTTGCYTTWAGAIHGIANDNVSGVALVEITVQRAYDGLYYDGATASWQPTSHWIATSGTTNWSLPFMPSVETMYLVTSRATDNMGLVQSPYGTGAFTYDISPPQSVIFTAGYLNTWAGAIQGLASDSASGVAIVRITLQRGSDNLYYTGASWSPTMVWITATGNGLWTIPFTPTVETLYRVTAQATDNCGNVQFPPSVSTFTYDITPPVSAVATTGCFNVWAGLIEGTTSDALSGIASVRITLQRMADSLYYNGSSWSPASTWITASGTTSWSLPFTPTVETAYTVTSLAIDQSGNVQGTPGAGAFTYDITPPQSSITTTGCLNGWLGAIQGAASDAVSGVARVQVKLQRASDGLYYSGASWEADARWIIAAPFAPGGEDPTGGTTAWSLAFTPTVQTVYTVTATSIDNCGNAQSALETRIFTYDIDSPSSEITTSGYYNSWAGAIEGTAHDALSGVAQVQIRLQRDSDDLYYDGGTSWTAASRWITVSGTTTWLLPFPQPVETAYTVTSRAMDHCGNVESVPGTATFVYDLTPPPPPVGFVTHPSAWTPLNSFTVTWTNLPDLAGATAAHFKWDTAPASNEDESPGSPIAGDDIQGISGISAPVEGVHQLFLWLEDRAGNVDFQNRNATSAGAFKWDATPPDTSVVNLDARQGCSGWYVSAVQANLQALDVNPDPDRINATSGISATFWRKNGNGWQQVAGSSFEIADQGTHIVEYYSVDVAGNIEVVHTVSPTIKIDTAPPTTYLPSFTGTLGPNEWYRSPVSVTLTAVDATSGVSVTYYQVNTGTLETGNSFYIAADGFHTIRYYSEDVACNQETSYTTTLKIDQTHPGTSHQLAGRLGDNGWFITRTVTVTLSASDAVTGVQASAGVDQVRYRIDGGPWQVRGATTSFTVAVPTGQKEYSRTVEYHATDLAGNAEPVHTLIIGMDFQAPSALPYRPYAVPGGWTSANCFDIRWFQNPVDFSGIGGAYYSFHVPVSNTDGLLFLKDHLTAIPCVQVPDELGDGLHNVYVWMRDRAGNSDHLTYHVVTVALDRNPPQVTPLVVGNQCGTAGWYNSPITVTFVATDALSGMASGVISYQVNGGGWIRGASYSEPQDGRYVIDYQATDAAGNTSNVNTRLVRLDRTAPEAPNPVWVEPGDWSSNSVFTIRWVNPGDLSGLAGVHYKQGSPPAWPADGTYVDGMQTSLSISATTEGLVSVYIWLADKACNSDQQKQAVATLKFDRTPPATTFSAAGTLGNNGWYTSPVLITLNCADSYSGCGQGSGHYRIGDGPWQAGNSFWVEADGTTTFSYYSVDLAGNAENAHAGTVKIDRTPPSSYAFSDSYSPSPSFTIRWDGADATSGIDTFDVQYRIGTAEPWRDWVVDVDPLQRSRLFTGVAGKVFYFRTRAKDKAGNVEAYSTLPDTYVSVDLVINGDLERDLGGEWQTQGVCTITQIYTTSYSGGSSRVVVLGCPDQRTGAPVGESMICQTLNVPSAQDMPIPMLRFRYHIFTYDLLWGPGTGKFFDSFNVGLGNPGQIGPTFVYTDGNPGPDYGKTLIDLGWREGTVDLRPYAGRTMKVCLANVTREDENYNTWTLVDEIRMVHLEHKIVLPIVQRRPRAQVSFAEAHPEVTPPSSNGDR